MQITRCWGVQKERDCQDYPTPPHPGQSSLAQCWKTPQPSVLQGEHATCQSPAGLSWRVSPAQAPVLGTEGAGPALRAVKSVRPQGATSVLPKGLLSWSEGATGEKPKQVMALQERQVFLQKKRKAGRKEGRKAGLQFVEAEWQLIRERLVCRSGSASLTINCAVLWAWPPL